MSFKWLDYLNLAKQLATQEDDASLRSAISRAYYAAFHTAKCHVEQRYPEIRIPHHGSNHDVVWDALRGRTRQECAAQTAGNRLRLLRTKADYDLGGLNLSKDTTRALDLADNVVRSLAAINQTC